MLCEYTVKHYVREGELEKIENYDKAIADKTQLWECHHRLELTLDGEFAHSAEDLKRMGMYYNRPYFELIFLTRAEHKILHGKTKSEEHIKKVSEALKGRKRSEETRKKIGEGHRIENLSIETRKKLSEANKGRKFSEEHRKNISEALKGKKLSEEHRNNVSKALKGKKRQFSIQHKKNLSKPISDFGKKYFEHYGYSKHENPSQYQKERLWYHKHNNKCSWEV